MLNKFVWAAIKYYEKQILLLCLLSGRQRRADFEEDWKVKNTIIKIDGIWHINNPGMAEYTLCGMAFDSGEDYWENNCNPEEKPITALKQSTCNICQMVVESLRKIRK